MEKWMPVKGYEGLYAVSNYGRVRSSHKKVPVILKTRVNKNGYEMVGLHLRRNRKMCYVHRLVAEAFLGECPTKCEVDHINKDRLDNRASNLRYLSSVINHAQAGESKHKAVEQYTLSGEFVATYPSRKDAAAKTGVERRNISLVALGKRSHAGGYIWRNAT